MKRKHTPGTTVLISLLCASVAVAHPVLDTADSLSAAGAQRGAITVIEEALADSSRRAGFSDEELTAAFVRLGELHYEIRNYESSNACLDSAIALGLSAATIDRLAVADAYEHKGRALRHLRDRPGSIEALQTALSYYADTPGAASLPASRVHNSLALAYRDDRQFDSSISHVTRAIAICREMGPQSDTIAAQYLNTLSRVRQMLGEYEEASAALVEAITLSVPQLGNDHPNIAVFYNNLGNLQSELGRFDAALESYEEALRIRRAAYGEKDAKIAQSINNVALVHYNNGRYAEAEAGFREAKDIVVAAWGNEHDAVAGILMNLGSVYLDQRRYGDAEAALLDGKAILESQERPDHARLAGVLTNLAIVSRGTERFDDAEVYLNEALRLKTEQFGDNSPQVATTLNSLGTLRNSLGDREGARDYFTRALSIEREAYGEQHPQVAARLLNLADLSTLKEDWATADSLYTKATTILLAVYGSNNRWVADAWERQALSYYERGEPTAALELLVPAFDIGLRFFGRNAQILSEPDALAFSTFLQNTADLLLSAWSDLDDSPSMDSLAARVILSAKGKVRDELLARSRADIAELDPAAVRLAEQLRNTRWRLSSAYVAGPGDDAEEFRRQLDSLTQRSEELESRLAELSANYRQKLAQSHPDPLSIGQALPEDTPLIEYMRFRHAGSDKIHYVAVTYQESSVRVIDLGRADLIDSLVDAYQAHMHEVALFSEPTRDDLDRYRPLARALYDRLIGELGLNDTDKSSLIIAPDGPISLLSFAGLIDPDGRFLAESGPIAYLAAARNILLSPEDESMGRGLLVIGAPDFDAGHPAENGGPMQDGVIRRHHLPISPLPATRAEAEAIARQWSENTTEPVTVLLDDEARETDFRSRAPGCRVIHLATHGFYHSSESIVDVRSPIEFGLADVPADNPLLKSGLYFAGVNRLANGPAESGADDGILTALEVSTLPLSGTEFVVLSACESGAGDVIDGEGVMGLLSAFHMAGAGTVVSSLWPVPDMVTAQFMESMYREADEPAPIRLHRRQLAALQQLRANGGIDHPYTWAPFIAVRSH